MEKLQIASKILLSLALIYFSTAIIMLVIETGRTREAIPEIIADINSLNLNEDVSKILIQVPEITEEVSLVRQEIPPILKEMEEIRKAIPPILAQIEETRKIIPPILEEVAAVRQELPESLAAAQKIVTDAKEISIVGGVTKGVGGAAKGVVTTPFRLLKKGADKVTGNEEENN